MKVRFVAALLLLASPAFAQTSSPDPLVDGYRQYYNGDKLGAVKSLEALVKQKPDDLAARFGFMLFSERRLDIDQSGMAAVEKGIDALLDAAKRRYDKNQFDGEALFYLAQTHMLRAIFRFDFDKGMWGAARDGSNAKSYSEAYLKRFPENADALFVLGVYNYYVEIAPAFAKLMRFLLFLPSGDRALGLKQLERAAERATLFAPEARLALIDVYSNYENRPADAIAVAERIAREFPGNNDVQFELAQIYNSPAVEDRARASAAYETLIARHQGNRSGDAATVRTNAIFGLAGMQIEDWRFTDGIATLTRFINERPVEPDWALPMMLLRRGNYRALLNDSGAIDDVQAVLGSPAMTKWHKQAIDLKTWMTDRNATGQAVTYAAFIPANRLVTEGKYVEARAAYDRLAAQYPNATQLKYRLAHLDYASGQLDRALAQFQALANGGKTVAENIRAQSLLFVGRIHDLQGRRDQAIKTYQRVADTYEKQAAAGAARVGLVTPYQRRAKP